MNSSRQQLFQGVAARWAGRAVDFIPALPFSSLWHQRASSVQPSGQ
jgi:hypothetical protein